MAHKKVFISYSHDDDLHKEWVRKFAEDLVQNGVEVLLDQWHLHIADDLGFFMEQSISQSDYTLLICTPNFADKVNNRMGGVGLEGELIVGNILVSPRFKTKFIPVLRKGLPSESIPFYLRSRLFIEFKENSIYKKSLEMLLRRIFDAPLYIYPKLGPSPEFLNSSYNNLKI